MWPSPCESCRRRGTRRPSSRQTLHTRHGQARPRPRARALLPFGNGDVSEELLGKGRRVRGFHGSDVECSYVTVDLGPMLELFWLALERGRRARELRLDEDPAPP